MLDCWRNFLRILKGSTGPGVTDTPSGRVQVDAGQEGGEFGGGHLDAIRPAARDAEGPAFESFGPDGQPVAVPIQDLDAIAAFVDEDEEMTGEGIERQAAGCQREPGRRSSCACRRVAWRGKRGPRRSVRTWRSSTTAMRWRRVWGSNPGATATRRPLERMSSRWGWEAGDRRNRIGNDGDREEVVVGTGGKTIVAGGRIRTGPAGRGAFGRSEARFGDGGRTRLESDRSGGNH